MLIVYRLVSSIHSWVFSASTWPGIVSVDNINSVGSLLSEIQLGCCMDWCRKEESRVFELERELEKARTEWSTLTKERATWVTDTKKARKLEADLAEMEKAMTQLRSIHQMELERKDAFCEAEKERELPRSCKKPITPCFR